MNVKEIHITSGQNSSKRRNIQEEEQNALRKRTQ